MLGDGALRDTAAAGQLNPRIVIFSELTMASNTAAPRWSSARAA